MSLLHFIACKIVNKGKVEFDKNCPPDYVGRRKKEIQSSAPRKVKVEKISRGGFVGEHLSKEGNSMGKVWMYIHGGGFVGGSPAARRAFTGYVVNKLESRKSV